MLSTLSPAQQPKRPFAPDSWRFFFFGCVFSPPNNKDQTALPARLTLLVKEEETRKPSAQDSACFHTFDPLITLTLAELLTALAHL